MANSSELHTFDCTRRAMERAAANFHLKLVRGTAALRAIACAAPLLGMLGTSAPLRNALDAPYLPGFSTCDCAGGVAETFVPLAMSLPITIFASVGLHFLGRQIETLDLDMRAAAFDVLNYLAVRR
jgi:biopolymer transport protein ExbB/TolQ